MSGNEISRDHRICMAISICAASKDGLMAQLQWMIDKLKAEECVETYHIVGEFDYKIMTMHRQMIVPVDSINIDDMAKSLELPKEAYEKVKTEYHFRKSIQEFNDTIDEEFEDN